MIIVRLMGGLGNQMFQYALGRSLAQRHNAVVKMDLSPLQSDPLRSYGLDCFHIVAPVASPSEVARLRGLDGGRLARQAHRLRERLRPYAQRQEVFERTPGFDPAVLQIRRDAYLIGYWQDERYFEAIASQLREDFTFRDPPGVANAALLAQIQACQSVSLHVRRTDYVTSPKVAAVMASCGLDYYQAAVDCMESRVVDPHFFVFSDDPAWAQDNLRLSSPTTFVSHDGDGHDHEDLRLMSACKHSIIANSSFSWWGAWLGDHPDKVVIAPQFWFADQRLNAAHQLPAHWTRQ